MQLTATTFQSTIAARVASRRQPRRVVVAALQDDEAVSVSRRSAAALLVGLPMLLASSPALAFGKDVRQAVQQKEARRAKLKASAEKMKVEKKADAAFEDSKYGLPEDATSPNMRALANDRARVDE